MIFRNGNSPFYPVALALTLLLPAIVIFQTIFAKRAMVPSILVGGRLMVDSGHSGGEGDSRNVLDGDPDTFSLLRFPSEHPQGTFLLWDMGLTHFPGDRSERYESRQAVLLRILSGICHPCSSEQFRNYARPRTIRLEVHYRQANDPDVDFFFPEPRVLFQKELQLPDSGEAFDIPLELPPLADSASYPDGIFLLVGKITVTSLYPGTGHPDLCAIRELDYADTKKKDIASPLQKNGTLHFWNRSYRDHHWRKPWPIHQRN